MTVTNFDLLQGIPEGDTGGVRADLSIHLSLDTWDRADRFEKLAVGFLIAGEGGNLQILGGRVDLGRGMTGAPCVVIVSRSLTVHLSALAARQLVTFCEGPDTPQWARQTADLIRATVDSFGGQANG